MELFEWSKALLPLKVRNEGNQVEVHQGNWKVNKNGAFRVVNRLCYLLKLGLKAFKWKCLGHWTVAYRVVKRFCYLWKLGIKEKQMGASGPIDKIGV